MGVPMFSRRASSVLGLVVPAGILGGCANSDELKARIAGRWGPNPAIQSSDVNTTMQNQTTVLGYIADEAGIVGVNSSGGYLSLTSLSKSDWYSVAQWGFNVGRQDCEVYLDNLFRMNREKQRNDSVLTAAGTAAAAILTGTSAGAKSLSMVAAAFGMSIAVNDAVYESYLFTEAPGLIANKVKELQDSYQNSITSDKVTTSDQAYSAIQNYY